MIDFTVYSPDSLSLGSSDLERISLSMISDDHFVYDQCPIGQNDVREGIDFVPPLDLMSIISNTSATEVSYEGPSFIDVRSNSLEDVEEFQQHASKNHDEFISPKSNPSTVRPGSVEKNTPVRNLNLPSSDLDETSGDVDDDELDGCCDVSITVDTKPLPPPVFAAAEYKYSHPINQKNQNQSNSTQNNGVARSRSTYTCNNDKQSMISQTTAESVGKKLKPVKDKYRIVEGVGKSKPPQSYGQLFEKKLAADSLKPMHSNSAIRDQCNDSQKLYRHVRPNKMRSDWTDNLVKSRDKVNARNRTSFPTGGSQSDPANNWPLSRLNSMECLQLAESGRSRSFTSLPTVQEVLQLGHTQHSVLSKARDDFFQRNIKAVRNSHHHQPDRDRTRLPSSRQGNSRQRRLIVTASPARPIHKPTALPRDHQLPILPPVKPSFVSEFECDDHSLRMAKQMRSKAYSNQIRRLASKDRSSLGNIPSTLSQAWWPNGKFGNDNGGSRADAVATNSCNHQQKNSGVRCKSPVNRQGNRSSSVGNAMNKAKSDAVVRRESQMLNYSKEIQDREKRRRKNAKVKGKERPSNDESCLQNEESSDQIDSFLQELIARHQEERLKVESWTKKDDRMKHLFA